MKVAATNNKINIKKNNTSYSLYSNRDYTLEPKKLSWLHTDVSLTIPENHFGLLTSKDYKLMGGVIDSDYTGEIVVMVYNISNEINYVNDGDEIAKMFVVKISTPELVMVDTLEESERGCKGFGSTGRN